MTYLAMFTNCSRFALTSFTDEVPYSSIPYIVLCWKFHLCWFQLYNLQHNERVGREDQHKLRETDCQERRPRCFHVAYLPWSCCCFHLWRFFGKKKIAYVPEAFFFASIMCNRLYGSSRVTTNFLGKKWWFARTVSNPTCAEVGL